MTSPTFVGIPRHSVPELRAYDLSAASSRPRKTLPRHTEEERNRYVAYSLRALPRLRLTVDVWPQLPPPEIIKKSPSAGGGYVYISNFLSCRRWLAGTRRSTFRARRRADGRHIPRYLPVAPAAAQFRFGFDSKIGGPLSRAGT